MLQQIVTKTVKGAKMVAVTKTFHQYRHKFNFGFFSALQ